VFAPSLVNRNDHLNKDDTETPPEDKQYSFRTFHQEKDFAIAQSIAQVRSLYPVVGPLTMLELTYFPSSCVSTCIFPVTWLCSIRCGLLVYESLQFDSNEPEGDRAG
jgi:hypothetical protein